jgi:hypothetical protein
MAAVPGTHTAHRLLGLRCADATVLRSLVEDVGLSLDEAEAALAKAREIVVV